MDFNYFIAYSIIGKPALHQFSKKLKNNLTCIATTSAEKIEFIQFIDGSGSKNEIFEVEIPKAMQNPVVEEQNAFPNVFKEYISKNNDSNNI